MKKSQVRAIQITSIAALGVAVLILVSGVQILPPASGSTIMEVTVHYSDGSTDQLKSSIVGQEAVYTLDVNKKQISFIEITTLVTLVYDGTAGKWDLSPRIEAGVANTADGKNYQFSTVNFKKDQDWSKMAKPPVPASGQQIIVQKEMITSQQIESWVQGYGAGNYPIMFKSSVSVWLIDTAGNPATMKCAGGTVSGDACIGASTAVMGINYMPGSAQLSLTSISVVTKGCALVYWRDQSYGEVVEQYVCLP